MKSESIKYFRQKKNLAWLSMKVVDSDIYTSAYDKRDYFGLPIINFPWLSDDIPRLP